MLGCVIDLIFTLWCEACFGREGKKLEAANKDGGGQTCGLSENSVNGGMELRIKFSFNFFWFTY